MLLLTMVMKKVWTFMNESFNARECNHAATTYQTGRYVAQTFSAGMVAAAIITHATESINAPHSMEDLMLPFVADLLIGSQHQNLEIGRSASQVLHAGMVAAAIVTQMMEG
jgi:Tfp pilus assembly ATPase PilU